MVCFEFLETKNKWLTKAVNETEEWFYQLKGDMLLRLVENGAIRDMTLKEGEMFLVPGMLVVLRNP